MMKIIIIITIANEMKFGKIIKATVNNQCPNPPTKNRNRSPNAKTFVSMPSTSKKHPLIYFLD